VSPGETASATRRGGCALPGCSATFAEDDRSGRRYCCPDHRRQARRIRAERAARHTPAAAHPAGPSDPRPAPPPAVPPGGAPGGAPFSPGAPLVPPGAAASSGGAPLVPPAAAVAPEARPGALAPPPSGPAGGGDRPAPAFVPLTGELTKHGHRRLVPAPERFRWRTLLASRPARPVPGRPTYPADWDTEPLPPAAQTPVAPTHPAPAVVPEPEPVPAGKRRPAPEPVVPAPEPAPAPVPEAEPAEGRALEPSPVPAEPGITIPPESVPNSAPVPKAVREPLHLPLLNRAPTRGTAPTTTSPEPNPARDSRIAPEPSVTSESTSATPAAKEVPKAAKGGAAPRAGAAQDGPGKDGAGGRAGTDGRAPDTRDARLRRERERRARGELARLAAEQRAWEAENPRPRAAWRGPKLSASERLSRAGETLRGALRSLSANRLRSALTTIGIVIGVAAVIVLVALGNGMKAHFNQEFSKLANQITITRSAGSVPGGGAARPLTDQDVSAIEDQAKAPDVAAVSPGMTGTVTLTVGQNVERASMVGATENYLDLLDRSVTQGDWFTSGQIAAKQRVVVLGPQAVALLWGPGTDPGQVVGSHVRIDHSNFTVAGILNSDGQNDNTVIVPFGAARAYLVGNGTGNVDQIIVKSTSAATVDRAVEEITGVLDTRHYISRPADRDYNVLSFTTLLTKSTQFVNFLTLFIVSIAAISLLVGGIGVANIMLVAVTERTREIGIRKAVGATRRAIMRQFLSEAVMLTGLGGLVGVALGVGVALSASRVLPTVAAEFPPPILTPAPVLIAFLVSLCIGVVAGSYPAYRAARMRPIQALRFE
jgi:putative ABC transport system permease protein